MSYYVGGDVSSNDLLGEGNTRYFYGLQRLDDGTLYFYKVDQLTSTGSIPINAPGSSANNFENFEYGVDYFDGRNPTTHSRPYTNLTFDQYRWDNRNCYYFLDTQGNLVVQINQTYTYTQLQTVSAT
jgi:hypothetical protein